MSTPLVNGTQLLSAQDFLILMNAVYTKAYGSQIDLDPETPQGYLCQSQADILNTFYNLWLSTFNQINPNLAQGVYLDAICALAGINREVATKTLVSATITGLAGTVLPVGYAQAINKDGKVFVIEDTKTIPPEGVLEDVGFQAVELGPIPCPANSLNRILTSNISGWDTIDNPLGGQIGKGVEQDPDLRVNRIQEIDLYSSSMPDSITASISTMDDVVAFAYLVNNTAAPRTIEGITLPPNAMCLSIKGGLDEDIARFMYSKKPAGQPMYGNASKEFTPENSTIPVTMVFNRPIDSNLHIVVDIKSMQQYPGNLEDLIKAKLVETFDSFPTQGTRIAASIYCSTFISVIYSMGVTTIQSLTLQLDSGPIETQFVSLDANHCANLDISNITVNVIGT